VEAEPYLLRGSREALRRGGTFEVELALTSAMKGLTRTSVSDARLLLAEALQEQGRWTESVDHLDHDDAHSPQQQLRLRSLELTARSVLPRTENEARECLKSLQTFLHETDDLSAKAQAVESMRAILFYLGDEKEGERTFHEAESLMRTVTDLGDRLLIYPAYAGLAWLTHRVRACDEALSKFDGLIGESQRAGVSNSSVVRLHNLNGCLLSARGKYHAALKQYILALELARRLGNVHRERAAADNIAMCHGRLGNYKDQQHWAEKALHLSPHACDDWDRIKQASRLAWSLCMQGENTRGVAAFEELAPQEDMSGRMWVQQARELLRADVYLLAGDTRKASAVANLAFESTDHRPLSSAYVGTVARWRALTYDEFQGLDTRTDLDYLVDSIARFDLVDQAEIVAARLSLDRRTAATWVEGRGLLAKILSELPGAVEVQLKRLGMI
jgi:tetratricopeptide (TPR) repeat protein